MSIEMSTGAVVERRLRPWRESLPSQRLLLYAGALVAITLIAISSGAVDLDIVGFLLGTADLSALQRNVLLELRLPRVLLAGAVGAALAIAGACLQGLFRNPLAEPQLIGVSSGAALGAISMIVFGNQLSIPDALMPFSLPLAAIIGALLVTSGLYALACRHGQRNVVGLLLLGIAVNAMSGVGIGLFTWVANDGELRSLTFWTMGSFGGNRWNTVMPAIALIAVALAIVLPTARQLDRLQLGELEAERLGVCLRSLKRRVIFGVAVAVGAGVAVAGTIGFVGLVVPHIARLLTGVRHYLLLPASALLGASLTIAADLGARTLVVPAEMPVGLITSAIGAPFFFWLILRVRGA